LQVRAGGVTAPGKAGPHTALLLTSATVEAGNISTDYVSCAGSGGAAVGGTPLLPAALNTTTGARLSHGTHIHNATCIAL